MITAQMLDRRWPKAPHSLTDGIIATAAGVLERHGITTPMRLAHFMAQISHESGGGTVTEENLNYTHAERIAAVWPARFTKASAQEYVRNPRALADKVYNGRMGNRTGTDDGWNFRGRGLIQITGREDYEEVGQVAGLDLIANPQLASAPLTALEVAASYWTWRVINPAADRDDLTKVTRFVNGGTIGIDQRRAWLNRWKKELL